MTGRTSRQCSDRAPARLSRVTNSAAASPLASLLSPNDDRSARSFATAKSHSKTNAVSRSSITCEWHSRMRCTNCTGHGKRLLLSHKLRAQQKVAALHSVQRVFSAAEAACPYQKGTEVRTQLKCIVKRLSVTRVVCLRIEQW